MPLNFILMRREAYNFEDKIYLKQTCEMICLGTGRKHIYISFLDSPIVFVVWALKVLSALGPSLCGG